MRKKKKKKKKKQPPQQQQKKRREGRKYCTLVWNARHRAYSPNPHTPNPSQYYKGKTVRPDQPTPLPPSFLPQARRVDTCRIELWRVLVHPVPPPPPPRHTHPIWADTCFEARLPSPAAAPTERAGPAKGKRVASRSSEWRPWRHASRVRTAAPSSCSRSCPSFRW